MKNQFFLFVLSLLTLTTYSQDNNTKKIDSLISYLEKNNQGIGTIAIAKGGKTIYSKQFGQKKLKPEDQTPENYHIGSVTKMLTATMIYQLVDAKKLQLDEKIAIYFPEVPNAKNISIIDLLSHKSGLKDYVFKNDSLMYWLTKPVAEAAIFSEIKRQGVAFQPGDSVRYSNTGYFLLTKILEKKYRKNYKAILEQQIIKPLHLQYTRSIAVGNSDKGVAKSFRYGMAWEEIKEFYFPNVVGVGDVVSTPEDMNTFMQALYSNKLISAKSLAIMQPVAKNRFGSGQMQFPFMERTFYGHGGDTYGSHTIVAYNPKDQLGVTLILNGQEMTSSQYLIAVLNVLYDQLYRFPSFNTTYTPDSGTFTVLEGTYSGTGIPLKIKIAKSGTKLTAQASGQTAFELQATGPNKFRKPSIQLEMEFHADQSMTLKQSGREFLLHKE